MFGPPRPKVTDENNKSTYPDEDINDAGYFIYEKEQQEAIQEIYDKILKYANPNGLTGSVFCNVIYNVIFNKEQEQESLVKKKVKLAAMLKENEHEGGEAIFGCLEPEVQAYPIPVFKVKQICTENTGASEKIYFIDNGGRVYNGFEDYLDNNRLPLCTMVYPKDGKYQIDQQLYSESNVANENNDNRESVVWLEHRQSPVDSTTSKILSGGDIVTTVVTVASMGVAIASLFTPIGPAVAVASSIGGGVGGAWSFGRSTQHLIDRGLHDESISPTADKSTFSAWMGIAGGAVGLAATGSSALLSRAVRTGTTVSRAATLTYDVVLVGNLVVNGVGLSFKSYDIYTAYKEGRDVSAVDVGMLVGHMFFFGNSVMNIRFARTIIESSQAQLLKDYEASLRSNRHRKEFQRMARNTRAAGTNDISSNEEIIRGINKISNKDDFFQAMVRNRKSLSASNARAAFSDGKVTVNSILTIDPIEFANLPREVRTEIIRSVVNPQTGSNIHSPEVSIPSGGLDSVISGSTPTGSTQTQTKGSGGTKPMNPGQQKPKNSAGIEAKKAADKQPKNSTPAKETVPAESKSSNSVGVKRNNVAGTEPKDSGTAQNKNSMKPPSAISPSVEANNFPEMTSDTSAKPILRATPEVSTSHSTSTKANASPGVLKKSANTKSDVPTATEPKDSTKVLKPARTAAEVKTKVRPNETTYKNFETQNGSVLNEFCTRHASALLQTAPPQITDFANVLSELRYIQNYVIIFGKLLEIGYKILQNLPRDEEIVLGNILSLIVEFLWSYLKECIRFTKPGIPIDDPLIRKCLDGALQELWVNVEQRIEVYVEAFKEWLRKTFPQTFKIPN
ncbi:uncharacterized protein [Venturia canescens]|nr:uncharacterized protein LOC122414285 isoform X2 [Venturia canescens]